MVIIKHVPTCVCVTVCVCVCVWLADYGLVMHCCVHLSVYPSSRHPSATLSGVDDPLVGFACWLLLGAAGTVNPYLYKGPLQEYLKLRRLVRQAAAVVVVALLAAGLRALFRRWFRSTGGSATSSVASGSLLDDAHKSQ